ncbi:hypothetical protein [Marinobacter mobilis]|uniref:4-amino-4-deoxy-L-arabinose transferase n=1 Tax=Marinobacter mobilis TaxID=488533 RepID=A0A1H2TIG7_9GAMM|nr:hypothetical protein [Marinobacter mobilis]SDW43796.1 hypothetical protein SAMN04487960_102457 [Marinobacter mobilis]
MWIIHNSYFHLLCASILTVSVYMVGLPGGFYFDDEWNILQNQALQLDTLSLEGLWAAMASGTAGPLGRPVAMLSFALNHAFFGLDPYYFKSVNLFIHLACGWAIYGLVVVLAGYLPVKLDSRKHLFAFFVMLLWLLHPLNLTAVLYPVQRMAGLSALFCLLGMLSYVLARRCSRDRMAAKAGLYICSFVLFWPLALASKENAALFPVYLFLLELTFLRFRPIGRDEVSRPLVLAYSGFLVMPAVLTALYFIVFPDWILNGYLNRDFSFQERLLTEARILIFYLGQLLVPLNSSLGMFHDDFILSTSLISPWTTLPAVLIVIFSIVWALLRVGRYPVIAFGLLFFFAAHSLESSVLALELVHEHRNYLASFPILMAIAYCLLACGEAGLRLKMLLSVSLILFLAVTTLFRAAVWGSPALHVMSEVMNHPLSPRANYGMGRQYAVYASSLPDSPQKMDALQEAAGYFKKSTELRASYTDGLFGLLMMEAMEGRDMGDTAFRDLLSRLAGAPFANNNYNYLNSLISCIENDDCQVSKDKVAAIIDASLENPMFTGRHREFILRRYEAYQKRL